MTGAFSGETVLEIVQNNGAGVVGKPGTWDEAIHDIEQALENNFSG